MSVFDRGGWQCVEGDAEGPVIVWSQKCKGGEGAVAAHKEKSSISPALALMRDSGDEPEADGDCRGPQQAGMDLAALLSTHTVLFLPTAAQKQAINSCGVEGEGTGYKVNELIVKPE